MNELVLTPEQVAAFTGSMRPIVVKTPDGRVLGEVGPLFTAEQIAEMKARAKSDGPRYSGRQVQAQLKALDAEWARTGGFDHEYMTTFLAKLSETDSDTYGPTG